MGRPVTSRPPAEHIKVLGRVRRQIEIDDKIAGRRKATILADIDSAIKKITSEEAKRS